MNQTQVSKTLAYLLRHHPETIGLTLSPEEGWAVVGDLLLGWGKQYGPLSREELAVVVELDPKGRFEFSESGYYIRAVQGHSILRPHAEECEPQNILFHGTAERHIPQIKQGGLSKMNRHDVHLSSDFSTAKQVGARHGKPVVLGIETNRMLEAGYIFRVTSNNVWLTDHVPVEYIVFHNL